MLSLDLRERIVGKVKEGLNFSKVAELFETTRQTVSKVVPPVGKWRETGG